MLASVSFKPQSLNFGGVLPGSEGPDITLDPAFPIDALSSAGGIQITAPVAANVTATVIGDTSHFSVRDVFVRHFVMRDIDPNELPHGHHGPLPKERALEIVSKGDGSLPLPVEAGQLLLIRVKYEGLANAGSFAGTLVIQGDTWNTIRIPLSIFLGDVTTTISTALLTIMQGRQAKLPITLKSVVGPETDVRYELSTLKLHTGISLTPTTLHVEQGKSLSALLELRASPDAPLGENTIFIRQFDLFGSSSLLLEINVVPAPIVDVLPLATEKIQDKYAQLGGRQSQLGRPIDPNVGVQHNGQEFFTEYHGGRIVFNSAGLTSAFATHRTVVIFKGIHCFGKSEATDEPYAIVGVYALDAENQLVTKKFPTSQDSYEGFVASTDATETSIISPQDTDWAPQTLVIVSTVMEHDSGDPNQVAGQVKGALDKVAIAAAAAGFPEVGPVLGFLDELGIPKLIVDVLGMGDDLIGTQKQSIDSVELIPKRAMQKFGNIDFNFESNLITNGDASYKLYYEVFVEEIKPPTPL